VGRLRLTRPRVLALGLAVLLALVVKSAAIGPFRLDLRLFHIGLLFAQHNCAPEVAREVECSAGRSLTVGHVVLSLCVYVCLHGDCPCDSARIALHVQDSRGTCTDQTSETGGADMC